DLASAFRLALAAVQPAPAEHKATHTLNILSELAGTPGSMATPAAAPRTSGLFDPKWRTLASTSTPAANAQSQNAEGTQPTRTDTLAASTSARLSPANSLPEEQPTNPVLPSTSEPLAEAGQAGTAGQSPQTAHEQIPTLDFPAPPESTSNSKRAGLLRFAK